MASPIAVTRIAAGAYHVEHEGRGGIVYVAGSAHDRWAFWNGHVFRRGDPGPVPRATRGRARASQALSAPMPATVVKVLVTPGGTVRKGDIVILLEAMKMELPIRAPADATVAAVHCREGQIVQSDTTLVELE